MSTQTQPQLDPIDIALQQNDVAAMIDAHSPSDQPLNAESFTPANPDDLRALDAAKVLVNEDGPLTETIGENAEANKALTSLADTLGEQAVATSLREPAQISLPELVTEQSETAEPVELSLPPVVEAQPEAKLNKHDAAIARIQADIEAGRTPAIESHYDVSALSILDAKGTLGEILAAAKGTDRETAVTQAVSRAREKASDTGGTSFSYKSTTRARAGFGAQTGAGRHTTGGVEYTPKQALTDTPDVVEVDDKVSAGSSS